MLNKGLQKNILIPANKHFDKKHVISWCLFDFANSSYSAVIAAVIFPVYYTSVVVGNADGDGDLWWGRAISLSMAIIALTSPFLGGMADYAGLRKRLLLLYTAVSVIAIASFSTLQQGMILSGFVLVLMANIGMEGGLVFYNSFLPRIAPKEFQGRVSAWGFGTGYAGSILSLLIALPLVKGENYELTWLMVAFFFILFSLPAFIFLPSDSRNVHSVTQAGAAGIRYTFSTLKELWRDKEARKFLLSYLVYEDGINTVIVFSSIFAATTLGFKLQELIVLYLVVQMTALAGAFIMAHPIDAWGPKRVVLGSLIFWSAIVTGAFFVQEKAQFWVVATCAGLGLGTVQAATRAFFTQFIPHEKESEYFGVYALVGKTSAIIGPLVFGYVSTTFGSQRPAILSIAAFFIIGLAILWTVKGGGPNLQTKGS